MKVLKPLFLGFTLVMLISVATTIFKPAKAEAFISPFIPEPGWSIPGDQRGALNVCDERVPLQSPGFVRWISLEGNPLARSADVPFGTPAIRLQLNIAAVVCTTRSAVYQTSWQFGPNVTPGVEGLWGATTFMNYTGFYGPGNFNVKGTYRQIAVPFTYRPAGGFTQSRDHTIFTDTRSINEFTTGAFLCVGNGVSAGSFYNFAPCAIATPGFVMRVNVGENEPLENIEFVGQDCTTISGWAFDPDVPTRSIPIDTYVDYPAGDPRATSFRTIANLPRSDVNRVHPSTGNSPHGFWIDISRFHTQGESRRYYMYFISYDQAGIDRGIRKLRVIDVPSCGTPFSLTPKGNVNFNDDEEPNVAQFGNIGVNGVPRTVNGITVTPRYELRRLGQPVTLLNPPPGSFPNRSVGSGGVTVITNDTRGVTGLVAGDRVCLVVRLSPGAGRLSTSGALIPGSTRDTETEVSCDTVVNKPYVSIYGNDVAAGATFDASCSRAPALGNGNIYAFNKLRGPNYNGAGVQLAAMALNEIDGFMSGSLRSPANPRSLTFSNTGGGTYGGSFGGVRCLPDYFADSRNMTPIAGPANISGGARLYNGPVQTSGNPSFRGKAAIYVNGDLTIDGNISYDKNNWSDPAQVPSLYVIVKGNIYITDRVTELDGVYVAQPINPGASGGSNGGNIYTCATTSRTLYSANDVRARCNGQLVINGSFIAQQVKFLRTFGTLRESGSDNATSGRAAEVFRFSPEMYLARPQLPPLTTGSSNKTQFYTTLPPVL